MKSSYITAVLASVLLAACSQPQPTMPVTPRTNPLQEQAKQRQYLALPGQSAVRVGTEDADEAFDRQVEAYGGNAVSTDPVGAIAGMTDMGVPAQADPNAAFNNAVVDNIPSPQPVPGDATTPGAVTTPGAALPTASDVTGAVAAAVGTGAANVTATVPGSADYAVQITNGTAGRIFVEAQDAAGHIFPCGPMFGGQSINTPPDPAGPLKGPITVVVRDPDKDGAPEIRRYQVQPPAEYKGKTVGITILPGGQYRADVDKVVYYTSPAPQGAQAAAAPATEPAPAPAPATTPAQ